MIAGSKRAINSGAKVSEVAVLDNFLASFTQPQQKWGLRQFGPYKSKIQAILKGFLYDNWGKTSI